jgi:hypothetical protein
MASDRANSPQRLGQGPEASTRVVHCVSHLRLPREKEVCADCSGAESDKADLGPSNHRVMILHIRY